MTTSVLFWFDVEDYITPESDDALKGLLEIFESHGVQGSSISRLLKNRVRPCGTLAMKASLLPSLDHKG